MTTATATPTAEVPETTVAVADAPPLDQAPAEAPPAAPPPVPPVSLDGMVPELTWQFSPRSGPLGLFEMRSTGAGLRVALALEASVPPLGFTKIDRRERLVGDGLRAAVRRELADSPVRRRVLTLAAEVAQLTRTANEKRPVLEKALAEARQARAALIAEARPGLAAALAALDEEVAGLSRQLAGLDKPLAELTALLDAARAQLRKEVDAAARKHAAAVFAALRQAKAAVLDRIAAQVTPLLNELALCHLSQRGAESHEMALEYVRGLPEVLEQADPPASVSPSPEGVPHE